ncbi:hypothetical protein JCM19297_3501 [Nonlabens ulvanivorans]|nr:hypothetical protein JCM19297_3501 [Nonlabens ulvanivorans]
MALAPVTSRKYCDYSSVRSSSFLFAKCMTLQSILPSNLFESL